VRQPFSLVAAGSMPARRRADFLVDFLVRRDPREVESGVEETLCVSRFRWLLRAACPRAASSQPFVPVFFDECIVVEMRVVAIYTLDLLELARA
jgi:hypothetical protein